MRPTTSVRPSGDLSIDPTTRAICDSRYGNRCAGAWAGSTNRYRMRSRALSETVRRAGVLRAKLGRAAATLVCKMRGGRCLPPADRPATSRTVARRRSAARTTPRTRSPTVPARPAGSPGRAERARDSPAAGRLAGLWKASRRASSRALAADTSRPFVNSDLGRCAPIERRSGPAAAGTMALWAGNLIRSAGRVTMARRRGRAAEAGASRSERVSIDLRRSR